MDYHGTNKHTHYVEKKQGINAYSLVKVDSLLIWGGANICMKIHDVLNNVTHLGNCSQRRLTAFAFYENGKQKRLYWKKGILDFCGSPLFYSDTYQNTCLN